MQIQTTIPVALQASQQPPGQGARILIVEDERHIARFLEYVLRKEGYDVAVEHSAEAALEKAKCFKPNAWLLDLVLPGMSGVDLLRMLRQDVNGDDVKVIVLSAHWFGQNEETLHAAGANAQCAKPIAPTTLVRKLRELGVLPVFRAGRLT